MRKLADILEDISIFLTVEHPCNYLEGKVAQDIVTDPKAAHISLYTALAEHGFRRAGNHIYRPSCQDCRECRSLRLPAGGLQLNRAQKRVLARNQDVTLRVLAPHFEEEHFALFSRYIESRHADGGMYPPDLGAYCSLLEADWCTIKLYEFRRGDQLLAVAVTDELLTGLSAVYTFFDPEETHRSLGTFAILQQVARAERLGLPWVYLGYWVQDCAKMAYKSRFIPHEIFLPVLDEWSKWR